MIVARPKKIKQDNYVPSDQDTKAMLWCLDNKIRVYPVVKDGEYGLEVEYVKAGKIKRVRSPKTYPKHDYNSKVYDLYKYLHKKHK